MKDCNNCKYKDYWEHVEPCVSCTNLMGEPTHWEPQTNADRIRQMSDEELARWLANEKNCSWNDGFFGSESISENDLLVWLKSPVEEGEG